MSNCSNCNNEKTAPEAVPYIVHESAMARAERGAKRLWTVIILLIVLLVGTNGVTQENADGYNNYIGNDGDIVNGETDNKSN